MKDYDVILVPGGGLQTNGSPHPWVQARLDAAMAASDSAHIIPLSGGTPHKAPPLNAHGFPITEAEASARYLQQKGVEPARIRTECYSFDTVGNAYFSRLLHVQPAGFKTILVVSSQFHIERCKALFNWVYNLQSAHTTQYQLNYMAASNTGISPQLLQARQQKEAAAIASITPIMNTITTVAAFHNWLYTEHAAYATGLQPAIATGELQQSY